MQIKRPSVLAREPEPSAWQHRQLLELVRDKVREVNGVADYDPVVAMALIATDPTTVPLPGNPQLTVPLVGVKTRLDAHKEVARYTHPTLKQVEVAGPGGGPIDTRTGLASEVVDLITALVRQPKGD